MGDHATLNDPAANAPDAAFAEKGKGKAQEPPQDLSMDEDESESESENEMVSLQFNGYEKVLELTTRVTRLRMVRSPPAVLSAANTITSALISTKSHLCPVN